MAKDNICQQCPYKGFPCVEPSGPHDAQIAVLGEAPGEEEERLGAPFIGKAGNTLDKILRAATVNRPELYIDNVLSCRPPGNRINTKDARTAIGLCGPKAIERIRRVRPNVIVPLGNTALRLLGYDYKITSARGYVMSTSIGKIIPTFHPSYIQRGQWEKFHTVVKDWQKIKRHSQFPMIPSYPEDFLVTPNVVDVEWFVNQIMQRVIRGEHVEIGVDIETYVVDQKLTTPIKTIAIATSASEAIVVPFITQSGNFYWPSPEYAARAVMALARLFESPSITKLVMNGMFDFPILMNMGFDIVGPVYDVEIGQYLVYHLSPHSLEYIVSTYTDYQPWKLQKASDDKGFRTYNARDACVLFMVKPALEEDINDNGVRIIFNNSMEAMLPICQMVLNGIHIDTDRLRVVKTRLEIDVKRLNAELEELSGTPGLNPNSGPQLAEVLFKKMKLRSDIKTKKGGKLSTAKEVLNRLWVRYPDNKFIDKLLDYRRVKTQLSNYASPYIHEDGRIHTEFKMHTAVTGRLTTSNPNLHGLPKREDPQGYIRGMYTPDPGRVFIEWDYIQAELVIFAILSNDEEWLTAFKEDIDIHRLNMIALLGYYDEKYRTFIKNFIFGFIYGSHGAEIKKAAPKELIQKISVEQMLANLFAAHPSFANYRTAIESDMDIKHCVKNPFGRTRYYVGKPTQRDIRSAINFPVQSTVLDIMHIKIAEINEVIEWPSDKLILQWHDAMYVETIKSRTDVLARQVKRIMETPVDAPNGMRFPLKVSVKVGSSLSRKDVKEWVN